MSHPRALCFVALLGLVHFFLQTKIDVTEAVLMAGFFVWLMGFRLLRRRGRTIGPLPLGALAVAAGLATALIEAAWYATMTGVMAERVLLANLDFTYQIRPAWWVLAAGAAALAAHVVRSFVKPPARTARRSPAAA